MEGQRFFIGMEQSQAATATFFLVLQRPFFLLFCLPPSFHFPPSSFISPSPSLPLPTICSNSAFLQHYSQLLFLLSSIRPPLLTSSFPLSDFLSLLFSLRSLFPLPAVHAASFFFHLPITCSFGSHPFLHHCPLILLSIFDLYAFDEPTSTFTTRLYPTPTLSL